MQGPGATNYDTAETDYDIMGRPARSTMPFSASAGTTNSSAPGATTTYDALGRVQYLKKPYIYVWDYCSKSGK